MTFSVMNTAVSVQVPPTESPRLAIAYHQTKDVMARLSQLTNMRDPESEISKINKTAGSARVPVSRDMHRLLAMALEYGERTGGALDITTASIAELWGFHGAPVPNDPLPEAFTRAARGGVGHRHVQLFDQGSIEFTSPYTRISLAGLSDAYAVDLAILQIRRSGVPNALVNMGGGTIRGLGRYSRQAPWRLTLHHPTESETALGQVDLEDGQALVTVRLYDNFVTIRGTRYGGIIDPRTGQTARGTAAVSVLGPTASEADALALALIVVGVEGARPLLENFPRCQALLIPDREPMEIWVTSGFEPHLKLRPEWAPALRRLELVNKPVVEE
jgi:thiamine biosynthesis lipoprotein